MSLIFSQGLSKHALSFKVILISTTVLSAALALKISVPVIADFAVTDAPSIYNSAISWLKPPYLYLVINCIIISIVASSKLQSKTVDSESSPSVSHQVERAPIPESDQIHVHTPNLSPIKHYNYGDFLVNEEAVEAIEAVRSEDYRFANDSLNTEVNYTEAIVWENGNDEELIKSTTADVPSMKSEIINNSGDSVSLSKSSWSPSPLIRRDSSEFSDLNEKPLVSARFVRRRSVKGSPEGGKTALRVSKSRKQETIETTWKTITEGRAMPLARHLKKSDTWESRGGGERQPRIQPPLPHDPRTMMKSETFNDPNSASINSLETSSPGGSGGSSGKLKREASLSQDDLNKRVEAFIKKFNEEMRLQRQESLSQYTEMMGTRL